MEQPFYLRLNRQRGLRPPREFSRSQKMVRGVSVLTSCVATRELIPGGGQRQTSRVHAEVIMDSACGDQNRNEFTPKTSRCSGQRLRSTASLLGKDLV